MIKKMSSGLHKNKCYFCQILMKLNFLTDFRKMLIKIHENPSSGGGELYHADGRTDKQTNRHDEVIIAFLNFAKAPKTFEISLG
jgi:hypothetical protein